MQISLQSIRRSGVSECSGAVLLLALLMRAFIPSGFMPVTQVDGVAFVICAGAYGAAPADPAHPSQRPGHADFTCPFAHSAGGGPPPTVLRAPNLLPVAFTVAVVPGHPRHTGTELRRYSSPRGPPQPA
jgi:hypothetical protein